MYAPKGEPEEDSPAPPYEPEHPEPSYTGTPSESH